MLEQTITVTLPETVYQKLQKAAQLTYRTIDDIVAATINATLAAPPDLPPELTNELAALHLLGDNALWATVQPSFSPTEEFRLQQLNHIGGERPLSPSEATEQAALLAAYRRSVLRRAQALAILKQRGHDISPTKQIGFTVNGDTLHSINPA